MANGLCNIAKGRFIELYRRVEENDPSTAGIIIVLLKANEAEGALIDHDNLSLLLGAAGNTEADFTNYARKTLTDADLAAFPSPDDTADDFDVDLPDQTWSNAGNGTNNTLTKAIVCYDPDTGAGDDTSIIPIAHYDFATTTDGTNLVAQFHADGFAGAA